MWNDCVDWDRLGKRSLWESDDKEIPGLPAGPVVQSWHDPAMKIGPKTVDLDL